MADAPTLRRGDAGDHVVELHTQLTIAGYLVESIHLDRFGEETERAVIAFQRRRGLDASGEVDSDTWSSLADAAHDFGERLLCRKTPMMRGDDVAELQLLLGSLGFDAGWIDGIFGAGTESAVADFQRNAGLPVDGVAGPTTMSTLMRLRLSANAARPVAAVRERLLLENDRRGLVGRRVVVGDLGVSPTVAGSVGSALRKEGARVLLMHHRDGSTHARAANQFDAEVYLGVSVVTEPLVSASFYETDAFSSHGGRHLAACAIDNLRSVLNLDGVVDGRATPLLRETRMPAVHLRLGPEGDIAPLADTIAQAVASTMRTWVENPVGERITT